MLPRLVAAAFNGAASVFTFAVYSKDKNKGVLLVGCCFAFASGVFAWLALSDSVS